MGVDHKVAPTPVSALHISLGGHPLKDYPLWHIRNLVESARENLLDPWAEKNYILWMGPDLYTMARQDLCQEGQTTIGGGTTYYRCLIRRADWLDRYDMLLLGSNDLG